MLKVWSYDSKTSYPSVARFVEHVQLKDLAPRTVESYANIVRQLGVWAAGDPALLDEERVRAFFLHLKLERGWSSKSMRQARASLSAFFLEMLVRSDWTVFAAIKTKDEFKLPAVLSRDEVRALLAAVREPRFRVPLRLIYECGLRLGEGLRVQVGDIDRAGLRLHVHLAKGAKDRMVPLSALMLEELGWWWKQHRNPLYLFPALGNNIKSAQRVAEVAQGACWAERMRMARTHLSESALQSAFRLAHRDSGIKHPATIHTLRHSYATHLLEEGVSLRYVSLYLGHATLEQTLVYTHLTAVSEAQTQAALARLSAAARSQ
jgi:integrase/recombinase XerD